ncbi:MAG TPA: DUF6544 family protein [Vulgatibacter sp.]
MRAAFALALAVHGLIHLMGFVKAFGLAPLSQLTVPISRPMGVLWLGAALLLLAAVGALFAGPRWFWLLGAGGLVASQVAVAASWSDARFGTIANGILLGAVVFGAFAWGPLGMRTEFERRAAGALEGTARAARDLAPITEADLAPLPPPVQRYLRFAGVVGKPRVSAVHVRMSGRIRGSADEPWMPFVAEQHSTFGPPRRFFWMDAKRGGLPVDVFHAYDGSGASMRVRLLSLIPLVDLDGDALTRTETVTLLNEMSIYAPSTLLDRSIEWKEIDERSAAATFTNGPHTVTGTLVFDDDGALADFWSDDRPSLAADGATLVQQRWSTPLFDYREQGAYRLASRGEARYGDANGGYTYLEFDRIEVRSDPPPATAQHSARRE